MIGSVNYHNLLKVFLDIKSLFFFPNFNTHTHISGFWIGLFIDHDQFDDYVGWWQVFAFKTGESSGGSPPPKFDLLDSTKNSWFWWRFTKFDEIFARSG